MGPITGSNLVPALIALAQARGFPRGFAASGGGNAADWAARTLPWLREQILPDLPKQSITSRLVAEEARPDHHVQHLILTLAPGLEVPVLWAVPHGPGPFPAVLALHDHGSEFRIGKEKCLAPPGPVPDVAQHWWNRFQGGRPFGDLALARGYAVLAMDALSWGGRIGNGYEAQQALAANLMALGLTPAGLMAWEDCRAAEWLAAQPQVLPDQISAMGFSMGGFRAWQVAALSPQISSVVSVCWMAGLRGLMIEGNNQTRGQSAFWMTHPQAMAALDLPDIAGLTAPKPALFLWGRDDPLFPAAAVTDAQEKLVAIWAAHDARAALDMQIRPRGHDFGPDRQALAFDWLDGLR